MQLQRNDFGKTREAGIRYTGCNPALKRRLVIKRVVLVAPCVENVGKSFSSHRAAIRWWEK